MGAPRTGIYISHWSNIQYLANGTSKIFIKFVAPLRLFPVPDEEYRIKSLELGD